MIKYALSLALGFGFAFSTSTKAGDDAPIAWVVEGPYRQTVMEETTIGPYRPGRLWIVDERGDCGIAWNCGDWWGGVEADRDEPATVPLPPSAYLFATAIALLWAIKRRA